MQFDLVTKSVLYTLISVAHTANIDLNHASSGRLQEVKNNEKF